MGEQRSDLPSPNEFVPGTSLGAYTVIGALGRGGGATVYAVRHRAMGTEHALKVLSIRASAYRLRREGWLQARLASPNVVPVYEVLDVDGRPALLMPIIFGGALSDLVAGEPVAVPAALALLSGIADGLASAHAAGIVHRDLKPSNILLDVQYGFVVPRVADFGLAKALLATSHTLDGSFVGTPGYAAPEQLTDAASVDLRADLWSLGAVLFELVTGKRLFEGETVAEVWAEIQERVWRRTPLPLEIERLVYGLLQPNPARRLPSIEAVRAHLVSVDRRTLALGSPVANRIVEQMTNVPVALGGPPAQVTEARTVVLDRSVHLPDERDAFVGREAELSVLHQLVVQQPVVAVLGPGGVGKTRLALHYGRAFRSSWAGVRYCDISDARGPLDIAMVVAKVLDIPLIDSDPVNQIGRALRGRGRLLLILDSFEHVAWAANPTLGQWREEAPQVRFVVTSRQSLGLGERSFRVEPLPLDDAVSLFRDRARAAVPEERWEELQCQPVQTLVELLDRLPLALELAAARTRSISIDGLLARMSERFGLLSRLDPVGQSRQVTLRATLDWSWQLLTLEEQEALAQLSVFEGGFTLDAAEAVIDVGNHWAFDLVGALVDKSLVRVVEDGRFSLLRTIQEYASEQLVARPATELRHGQYFAEAGTTRALAALDLRGGVERFEKLADELDNLVVACRRALDRDDLPVAVRTLRAVWSVVRVRGPALTAIELAEAAFARAELDIRQRADVGKVLGEARFAVGRTQEAVLPLSMAATSYRQLGLRSLETFVRAAYGTALHRMSRIDEARKQLERALVAGRSDGGDYAFAKLRYANFLELTGDTASAELQLLEAVDVFRRLGVLRYEAQASVTLGQIYFDQGRLEEATAELLKALDAYRALGDRLGEAEVLLVLSKVHMQRDELSDAEPKLTTALQIAVEHGDRRLQAMILNGIGKAHYARGDTAKTEETLEEGLAVARDLDDVQLQGLLLGNLGVAYELRGSRELARAHYRAALTMAEQMDDPSRQSTWAGNLGSIHREEGDFAEAAKLYARAVALSASARRTQSEGHWYSQLAAMQARLGDIAGATASLELARELIETVSGPGTWSGFYTASAEVAALAGDLATARRHLVEAEASAQGYALAERQVAEVRQWLESTFPSPDDASR